MRSIVGGAARAAPPQVQPRLDLQAAAGCISWSPVEDALWDEIRCWQRGAGSGWATANGESCVGRHCGEPGILARASVGVWLDSYVPLIASKGHPKRWKLVQRLFSLADLSRQILLTGELTSLPSWVIYKNDLACILSLIFSFQIYKWRFFFVVATFKSLQ